MLICLVQSCERTAGAIRKASAMENTVTAVAIAQKNEHIPERPSINISRTYFYKGPQEP